MNTELVKAIDLIVEEKGISKDFIYNALESALASAYKKMYELDEYSDSNMNGIILHGVYTQLPHIITILYEIRNKIVTVYKGKIIIIINQT